MGPGILARDPAARDLSSGLAAEFGNDVVDFAGGNGEGTMAHGAGDVDTENFSFEVDEGRPGMAGPDDLVVIEGVREVVFTAAELTATGAEG